jgi:REP element-mobilizing transposase RayT
LHEKTAVHVTLRVRSHVPSLRSRRRFAAVVAAFRKFGASVDGFRLVHFAVLSNHLHFVVEVDSKRALSLGMQKIGHSISRRLNALSVRASGGRISTKSGVAYSQARGWLGRVFAERYHAHVLASATEMAHAVRYVRNNAEQHFGASFAREAASLIARPVGYLLQLACTRLRR